MIDDGRALEHTRAAAPAAAARGFTLVEIGVALLLLSLLLSIAIPSTNALTGAHLRSEAGRLQGLMRDTYARTAMSGDSHRIVFDLDASTYWVEHTEGGVVLPRDPLQADREGRGILTVIDERIEGLEDSDEAEDIEKLRLYSGPTWQPVAGDEGKPHKLHTDVKIWSAWVDHMEGRVQGGQAALHFFPGGYTQEAQIVLTDDDAGERTLTIVTEPLTGETYVDTDVPDLPNR